MANRINISLNNQMLATLDLMAEKCGMTRSEYIRNMIIRDFSRQSIEDDAISVDDVYKRMDSYY